MKKYNIKNIAIAVLIVLWGTGCKDFLEEKSISNVTTDSYIVSEAGFEDLVRSCYPLTRDMISAQDKISLALNGTDIFTQGGWNNPAITSVSPFEMYDVTLNSSLADISNLWDILYREISRTNTAIERAEGITYVDAAKKAARVSEAKFLRALSYFYLVQTWGDVPMPLTETIAPNKAVVRVASSEIYTQIIKDLTEAEAALPVTATDYGRATKGAAQFLLAKVYLTRGWNYKNSLGGSATDFTTALGWADKVIAAYPLVPAYKTIFPLHDENPLKQYTGTQNDRNSEVVFAVQYSSDVLTYGNEVAAQQGNCYHSMFGGSGETLPGNLGRTSDYNRHLAQMITAPAMYRLFDPDKDSRYAHNFVDAQYALKDAANYVVSLTGSSLKISYVKGDTVAYFPPWNKVLALKDRGMDVGGTKKFTVIPISEYGNPQTSKLNGLTPLMWKFWQPGIQYGDGYGTFDFALFRSAEAYLIAAEAILKGATGGALGTAQAYYNKVLDRAVGVGVDPQCAKYPDDVTSMETVSYRATASNLTIDMILDESARELMGEFNRWWDLKRTGKLIERTKKMNPWAKKVNKLAEFHLVRPIPQTEIDRSSPAISQNQGY
ncbi:MAG: carbohydrate-binding protein SusD [Bacteroidetes bacterium GWF2_42_66]|nr:MAG: carbohydrate-binding protein SusD [Bacteroidetes bacterium GWA2_42_15]OFY03140.1 MAG: carbohydrate-binding protein SusD [Bacteroidetes bacterium GWE2_42_39]OFY45248.1 MAG: carbohydrate-binding protein SusD [Bacteroidetes bacterium GWF2_42_66]HBL74092.1 RagB/SusD family nutrient uptake outer membrane protein [Prolixibacteraceae bacterium]HCU63721.1 RagB/SusD family nutrient uptake outer membrane protein [Prolixibacteraceae bacterium]